MSGDGVPLSEWKAQGRTFAKSARGNGGKEKGSKAMAVADYEDSNVVISWRIEGERSYETDFEDMAKILGISKTKLAKILDGDDSLDSDDVSEAAKKRLAKHANEDSDEWQLEDIQEG